MGKIENHAENKMSTESKFIQENFWKTKDEFSWLGKSRLDSRKGLPKYFLKITFFSVHRQCSCSKKIFFQCEILNIFLVYKKFE